MMYSQLFYFANTSFYWHCLSSTGLFCDMPGTKGPYGSGEIKFDATILKSLASHQNGKALLIFAIV
jgi:hypothetical protein